MHDSFLIYSSADGHLGCFHVLAIIISAAMNIGVHVSLSLLVSSRFDYRTSTGLGEQTLGGHKQNLVCTRTQEKGAVTPQETDPDLPIECPGVSSEGMGQG